MSNRHFETPAWTRGVILSILSIPFLVGTLGVAGMAQAQLYNPCPYTNDGDCDEPNGLGYCAWGTDTADCSNPNSNYGGGSGYAGGGNTGGGGYTGGGATTGGLMNPCPYTNDGDCDEPEGLGYCAEGTDVADCANPYSNYGHGPGYQGGSTGPGSLCTELSAQRDCTSVCQAQFPETPPSWYQPYCDIVPPSTTGRCGCRLLSADEIGQRDPIVGPYDNFRPERVAWCRDFCGSYGNNFQSGNEQCMLSCVRCDTGGLHWAVPSRPSSSGYAGCCFATGSTCGGPGDGWRVR